MKTESIQSPVSQIANSYQQAPELKKEQNDIKSKEQRGDSVSLSLEGQNRLRETQATELSENKQKTSMRLENVDGKVIYQFRDKETDEVIKEIPPEYAREQSKRIDDFLSKIQEDILS